MPPTETGRLRRRLLLTLYGQADDARVLGPRIGFTRSNPKICNIPLRVGGQNFSIRLKLVLYCASAPRRFSGPSY